jgi:hypothetical protein
MYQKYHQYDVDQRNRAFYATVELYFKCSVFRRDIETVWCMFHEAHFHCPMKMLAPFWPSHKISKILVYFLFDKPLKFNGKKVCHTKSITLLAFLTTYFADKFVLERDISMQCTQISSIWWIWTIWELIQHESQLHLPPFLITLFATLKCDVFNTNIKISNYDLFVFWT